MSFKRTGKALMIVLALIALGAASLWAYRTYKGVFIVRKVLGSDQWQQKMEQFKNSNIPDNAIVLLGDSHSAGFDETLLDTPVVNHGIGGDVTEGLLRRIKATTRHRPSQVFLMIGINDIIARIPDDTILSHYQTILQRFHHETPQTKVVVQSILPTSIEGSLYIHYEEINRRARHINQELEQLAKEFDYSYLDLYPLFEDARGKLQAEYTSDQLHLNTRGYRVWARAIREHLSQAGNDQEEANTS